jgi:DNA-directed RNA polymerase subunit K/omega
VESRSKNFLTMALEEIAQGQLKVTPWKKEKETKAA